MSLRERYRDDGVVFVPGALCPETLKLALDAFEWSLAHPGPAAGPLPARDGGTFYQDLANPAAFAPYRTLVRDTEIGDLVAELFAGEDVWFMYEQVFLKEGPATRRTPWHQDLPYLPVEGDDLAVVWIPFDPVDADGALELVAGSHRGALYDGSRFDPEDDTAPLYGTGELPRLPDLEAERERWKIVSWPARPGDVVVFHPSLLHGGAATREGRRRRTLSLRFFGADARVAARPGGPGPRALADLQGGHVHPLARMRASPAGAPFRDPAFPRVRPRA